MQRLNSPWLTLVVLAGFITLCYSGWRMVNQGYTPGEVAGMDKLVARAVGLDMSNSEKMVYLYGEE